MKPNPFLLLVLIFTFSSCNTGRFYAKYRVGGKSKKEENRNINFLSSLLSLDENTLAKKDVEIGLMPNIDTFHLDVPPKKQNNTKTFINEKASRFKIVSKNEKFEKNFKKTNLFKKREWNSFIKKKEKKNFLILLLSFLLIATVSQLFLVEATFWLWFGLVLASSIVLFILLYATLLLFFIYAVEKKNSVYSSFKSYSFNKKVNLGEKITNILVLILGVLMLIALLFGIAFLISLGGTPLLIAFKKVAIVALIILFLIIWPFFS